MPRVSPLVELHEAFIRAENDRRAEAVAKAARGAGAAVEVELEWLPFGPDHEAPGAPACMIIAGFGSMEAEYAAIRRGAGLRDANERATLRVRGSERSGFLQRMLTQDLTRLRGPGCAEAFWLNRKGRIDADLLLVETGAELLIDVDVHAAGPTRESLDRFLFNEDATIEDATDEFVRLSLHGPGATKALEQAGLTAIASRSPGGAAVVIDGAARGSVGARRDQCATAGFEIFVPLEHSSAVWSALASTARPIGWDAFNMARIEGGTPLFRVDFGTDSLPHETGVLASHVSFTKGCYLGQEIVARMQSLGAPKQQVVRFRSAPGRLPIAGAPLTRPGESLATPIGAVTSSIASPMLGGAAIGFATVRSAVADAGRRLVVHAEGEPLELEVLGAPAPFIAAARA